MRKRSCILLLVLFCITTSFAQQTEYPKADVTVGYTLNRVNSSRIAVVSSTNGINSTTVGFNESFNGFTVVVAGNPHKNFGVEGDLTYTTKTFGGLRVNLFSYMGGPRFTIRPKNSKLQPFVHALFGGVHESSRQSTDSGFAGKFGGGLDIVATKHVAIRVFQVDYHPYRLSQSIDYHNVAFTFGLRIF